MDKIIFVIVLIIIGIVIIRYCNNTTRSIIESHRIYNHKITLLNNDLDELREKIKKLEQDKNTENMEEQ